MDHKIEEFQQWFNEMKPLNGKKARISIRYNTQDDNILFAQNLPNIEIYSSVKREGNAKSGTAYVGYGYGCGVVFSHNNKISISHQLRYLDSPIWHMDVSNCFGNHLSCPIDEEDIDPETQEEMQNNELLQWLIWPGGNQEIAYDVFKILIFPVLNAVCGRMPGRTHKSVDLFLPLIANKLEEPNWEKMFDSFGLANTQIRIHPNAHLLSFGDDERLYSIVIQYFEYKIYYLVDIVERSDSGEPISIGAYAFTDDTEYGDYTPMKEVQERVVEISSVIHRNISPVNNNIIISDLLVENQLEEQASLKYFLGTHTSSFQKEFFTANETALPEDHLQRQIFDFLSNKQSLQVEQIAGKLCRENNLLRISLSDMVTVASKLEDTRFFIPTTITRRCHTSSLETDLHILGQQEAQLERIPSNFGSICWECSTKRYTPEDYGKTTITQLKVMKIDDLLAMLISYFNPASTEEIAEELLYVYDKKGEPTARFVAELFWHLLQCDQFIIKAKSSPIQDYQILETKNELVDTKQSQRTGQNLPPRNNQKAKKQNNKSHQTWVLYSQKPLDLPIEKLNLSTRTYNALHRGHIRTVKDITAMTQQELYKVRNLGNKQREEIHSALERLGVKITI